MTRYKGGNVNVGYEANINKQTNKNVDKRS